MLTEQQALRATTAVALRNTPNPNAISHNLNLLQQTQKEIEESRARFRDMVDKNQVAAEANDTNYIFLHFVRNYLPVGMIGLLFAVVFLASWGSISAALHALSSSTLLDVHLLLSHKKMTDKQELRWARLYTLLWGIFSILVAMFATRMGSLIEAVNELGSLFYGVILGIFLVAFFLKSVSGRAVFMAAVISEVLIFIIYKLNVVGFLWFNVIGSLLVILIALVIQAGIKKNHETA
jgi:Na+/proline symporter